MIDTALNETEQNLKQMQTKLPEIDWQIPMSEEEFDHLARQKGISVQELLPYSLDSSLSEEEYIPGGGDVAVIPHTRYLPAAWHSHNFFEFTYVYEGQCTNYMHEVTIPMQAGDVCLTAPNTEHAVSVCSDDTFVINFLIRSSTFDTAFLDLISGQDVLTAFFTHALFGEQKSAALLFHTGYDTVMRDFIEYAYEEYRDMDRYYQRMMNNLIHAICVILLRRHEKDVVVPAKTGEETDDNLIFIMNYIQSNYNHITLAELSDFFHYSERHMSRLIKESTGKRFSELLRDLRLHRAADLLHNPDLSVAEIVEEVGYTDVSGFYRMFKTAYGVTPAEYREAKNS